VRKGVLILLSLFAGIFGCVYNPSSAADSGKEDSRGKSKRKIRNVNRRKSKRKISDVNRRKWMLLFLLLFASGDKI